MPKIRMRFRLRHKAFQNFNNYHYFFSCLTKHLVIGLFQKGINMYKTLTKAEEQIMQVIWNLDKAFLREIMDALAEPKPHQNTVATIIKILVDKDFVGVNLFGRMHQYYPLVAKDAYTQSTMNTLVRGYFEGSFSNAVSFMVKEKNISIDELEMLLEELKKKKK